MNGSKKNSTKTSFVFLLPEFTLIVEDKVVKIYLIKKHVKQITRSQ